MYMFKYNNDISHTVRHRGLVHHANSRVRSTRFIAGTWPSIADAAAGFGPSPRVISYVNGNTSRLRRRTTSPPRVPTATQNNSVTVTQSGGDPFRRQKNKNKPVGHIRLLCIQTHTHSHT